MDVKIQFEQLAQELTEHLKKANNPLKVDFPRGWIRTIGSVRTRWPYLSASRCRTLACVVQLCDINRWNLNVWSIGLTAGTMLEWHYTLPVTALIETLVYEYGVQEKLFPSGTKAEKAINVLNSQGIIKQKLRDTLQELREYRNEIHLYLKTSEIGMFKGKPAQYNKAVKALHELEAALKTHWDNQPTPF